MVFLNIFKGGYYDDNNTYVPGESWDSINECYPNEEHDNVYPFAKDHDDEYDEGNLIFFYFLINKIVSFDLILINFDRWIRRFYKQR